MNTLTPLAAARDALDGLTLYVPLGTSYPAVIEKCAEAIAAAPSITGAVAAGLRALDDAKCTWPPPSNRAPGAIELAAVAAHVRRHYADTAAADAFADGYYRAWDSRGHALPAPDEHADAWLAGQQMRPDYAAHVRAVEHADETPSREVRGHDDAEGAGVLGAAVRRAPEGAVMGVTYYRHRWLVVCDDEASSYQTRQAAL